MKRSYADEVIRFKALADETRLMIVEMIAHDELCACEILEDCQITQSTLSYHMKLLTESGLVDVRRDGKRMLYQLNPEIWKAVKQCCEMILSDESEQ